MSSPTEGNEKPHNLSAYAPRSVRNRERTHESPNIVEGKFPQPSGTLGRRPQNYSRRRSTRVVAGQRCRSLRSSIRILLYLRLWSAGCFSIRVWRFACFLKHPVYLSGWRHARLVGTTCDLLPAKLSTIGLTRKS